MWTRVASTLTSEGGRRRVLQCKWLTMALLLLHNNLTDSNTLKTRCLYNLSCSLRPNTVRRQCQFRIIDIDGLQSSISNSLIVNCSTTAAQFKAFPPISPGDLGFHLFPDGNTPSCTRQALFLRATNGSAGTRSKRSLIGCFCSYGDQTDDVEMEQCAHSIQATWQGAPSSDCPQRSRMIVIPCRHRHKVTGDIVAFTKSSKQMAAPSSQAPTSTSATADVQTAPPHHSPTVKKNNDWLLQSNEIYRCPLLTDCYSQYSAPKRSCNFWVKAINSTTVPADTEYLINSSAVERQFKELPELIQGEIGFHPDQRHGQNCAKHMILLKAANSIGVVYQLACFCKYKAEIFHHPQLQQCVFNIKTVNSNDDCPQSYRTLVLPSEVKSLPLHSPETPSVSSLTLATKSSANFKNAKYTPKATGYGNNLNGKAHAGDGESRAEPIANGLTERTFEEGSGNAEPLYLQ